MTNLLDKGELAVDAYLRNLIAIDEEVVARHIPHTLQVGDWFQIKPIPIVSVNMLCNSIRATFPVGFEIV